ncbi:MAG: pentapeptide repeat-containing protein [Akkermansiaceae bacterium]
MSRSAPNPNSKAYRNSEWYRRWSSCEWRSRLLHLIRNGQIDADHPCVDSLFDLRGINLHNKKLPTIVFENCLFFDSELRSAVLTKASFDGSEIAQSYFNGAKLYGSSFQGGVLNGVNFNGANLCGANFDNAVVRGCSFDSANLKGVSFAAATLENVSFLGAKGLGQLASLPWSIDSLALFYNDLENCRQSEFERYIEGNLKKVIMKYKYDVAISFAGEDRDLAEKIAAKLKSKGKRVFYDEYVKSELWGKDLYTHLSEVYHKSARFCVVLVSAHYARKNWTTHERRAAQARAFEDRSDYILPIRLDDTKIAGILPTTGYLEYPKTNVDEIVRLLLEKIGSKTI